MLAMPEIKGKGGLSLLGRYRYLIYVRHRRQRHQVPLNLGQYFQHLMIMVLLILGQLLVLLAYFGVSLHHLVVLQN